MYLRRKIDRCLLEWKSAPDKLPLIVTGARQVGKTESILKFAKENYESLTYVNFAENPLFSRIVGDGYSPDKIVRNMSLVNPAFNFVPGKTLIFFDEIQACPEIASSLKFFKLDGRYDVICSGSLLGVQLSRIESISVGYQTVWKMTSLDFEEFLWACGYGEGTAEDIRQHVKAMSPFSENELDAYESLFFDYMVVGGMPAVVSSYLARRNFQGIPELQNGLIGGYRSDVRKYAGGLDQERIIGVMDSIAPELGKENKKFVFSHVRKGGRFADYFGCIEWLRDAGLVTPSRLLNFPEIPLRGNTVPNAFKVYFFDTGLLLSLLDPESGEDFRVRKNFGVYKGAVFENSVAECLSKSGLDLYYYKRPDSTLELDFVLRTKDGIVPVEVKSKDGNAYSLREAIANPKYADISEGIKITRKNISYCGKVLTLPHFCAFFIKDWLRER